MLLSGKNWRQHQPWVIISLIVLAAASSWFFVESTRSGEWPGGSSLPGFTLGVIGGLIIIFEFLLWWRKKVRVWRIGRAQAWLRAHIWLGLLCLPLLIYHSGFRLGGTLSTYLMVLLVIVVASGVWGLWMQNRLPQRMLADIPAETIYSQIERLSSQQIVEMEQLVLAVCGPEEDVPTTKRVPEPVASGAHLVVGAVRTVGRVQGKVIETWVPPAPIADTEPLRIFFRESTPFLRHGASARSPLANPNRAAAMFQDLKTKLPLPAHPAVDRMQAACAQRRQWDEQVRLHWWLHSWLWLHFPLSVALVVLMFVHIWVALKYW